MKTLIDAPDILHGNIILPASKSISNRALVIRALSRSRMPIENISDCDDSRVVIDALRHMPPTIDIKAAGTAMRFLTSMLATVAGEHIITGTERMRNRPISVLVDALRNLGADIHYTDKEGFPPLRIRGKSLSGGKLTLKGNVSSQYISSLLMIGPTLAEGLLLELSGEIVSRPYIDMTLCIMQCFGAQAEWVSDRTICVKPIPYTPIPYYIENDWSAASYWYEMVALSPDKSASITLPGLFPKSLQGDASVARIFGNLGVATCFEGNTVRISKGETPRGEFVFDMMEQPDLAQTVAVTCCLQGIRFRITGLQTLRIKETDRMAALQRELEKLGFVVKAEDYETLLWDGETTNGTPPDNLITIDTYDDHRMAMAFAPVSLLRTGIAINNPEVVSKSYPQFWEDMEKAGFKLTRL